jgi:hypothetical protein
MNDASSAIPRSEFRRILQYMAFSLLDHESRRLENSPLAHLALTADCPINPALNTPPVRVGDGGTCWPPFDPGARDPIFHERDVSKITVRRPALAIGLQIAHRATGSLARNE